MTKNPKCCDSRNRWRSRGRNHHFCRPRPIFAPPEDSVLSRWSHPTVDIRDFTTQYWAYSVKLDASIADKAKVSTQLDPKLLAQVSDALQEARELRQFVVAGYNSCAITQPQYAQIEARFHAMDGLAREINELLSKPSISREGSTKLAGLISQYGDLARQRGSQ